MLDKNTLFISSYLSVMTLTKMKKKKPGNYVWTLSPKGQLLFPVCFIPPCTSFSLTFNRRPKETEQPMKSNSVLFHKVTRCSTLQQSAGES